MFAAKRQHTTGMHPGIQTGFANSKHLLQILSHNLHNVYANHKLVAHFLFVHLKGKGTEKGIWKLALVILSFRKAVAATYLLGSILKL